MRPRALECILQTPVRERSDLIAEGLRVLAEHVRALRADVLRLDRADGGRGLALLQAQLEEEAAKSLILLDLVRLGWSDQTTARRQITYFYEHLPRCIYAEMVDMRPATFGEVRTRVGWLRASHYLDGPNDVAWIFRNHLMAQREQTLYVDYVDYGEDGGKWETPVTYDDGVFFHARTPVADLVIALDRLGITDRAGLDIVAEAWVGRSIDDDTHWQAVAPVNERVIEAAVARAGAAPDASDDDVRRVLDWGFPMGGLALSKRRVDPALLEKRRAEWHPDA